MSYFISYLFFERCVFLRIWRPTWRLVSSEKRKQQLGCPNTLETAVLLYLEGLPTGAVGNRTVEQQVVEICEAVKLQRTFVELCGTVNLQRTFVELCGALNLQRTFVELCGAVNLQRTHATSRHVLQGETGPETDCNHDSHGEQTNLPASRATHYSTHASGRLPHRVT